MECLKTTAEWYQMFMSVMKEIYDGDRSREMVLFEASPEEPWTEEPF